MTDVIVEIFVSRDGLPQIDTSLLGGSGYDPVNELMRAIILRTIEDFNSSHEFYDEALEYMNSEDDDYIFSFVSICKHLGFDPDKTRHSIMYADHKISTRRRAA